MHGTSRASLRAVQERLDTLLRSDGVDAAQVGDDLLAVASLLDDQRSLRRALIDPGRDGAARAGLAQLVLAGQVLPDVVDLTAGAVRDRWGSPGDLAAGLEELGVDAHLVSAQRAGRLDAVEDELFRFTRIVESRPDLRAALVDRAAPRESRRALVHLLLDGRVAPETLRLVEHAVLARRERSLDAALDRLSDLVARRRRHVVATVRVALPLTEDQRARLVRTLSAGRDEPVDLDVIVDPAVIGGIQLHIGDEVIDGSIAARLDDARRRMAG